MQPRDFSDFADQLNLQQGLHCEALYRTATGRWYYSLYNEVKSWRYEKNIGREAYFLIGTNDEARYEINVANPKKALPWFRHFLKDQEVS